MGDPVIIIEEATKRVLGKMKVTEPEVKIFVVQGQVPGDAPTRFGGTWSTGEELGVFANHGGLIERTMELTLDLEKRIDELIPDPEFKVFHRGISKRISTYNLWRRACMERAVEIVMERFRPEAMTIHSTVLPLSFGQTHEGIDITIVPDMTMLRRRRTRLRLRPALMVTKAIVALISGRGKWKGPTSTKGKDEGPEATVSRAPRVLARVQGPFNQEVVRPVLDALAIADTAYWPVLSAPSDRMGYGSFEPVNREPLTLIRRLRGTTRYGRSADPAEEFIRSETAYLIQRFIGLLSCLERMMDKGLRCIIHQEQWGADGTVIGDIGEQLGLAVMGVMHGSMTFHPMYRNVTGRRFCLWGPAFQRMLVDEAGNDPDLFVLTGNPRFDDVTITPYPPEEQGVKEVVDGKGRGDGESGMEDEEEGTEDERPMVSPRRTRIVTLISQPSRGMMTGKMKEAILETLARVARERDDIQVLVRKHRLESDDDTPERISSDIRNMTVSDPDEPLFDLLARTDLVVASYSTVITEAVVAQRPVIVAHFKDDPYPGVYPDAGVAHLVRDAEEFRSSLHTFLDDPGTAQGLLSHRDRFIEDMFLRLDGKGAERTAEVIRTEIGDL